MVALTSTGCSTSSTPYSMFEKIYRPGQKISYKKQDSILREKSQYYYGSQWDDLATLIVFDDGSTMQKCNTSPVRDGGDPLIYGRTRVELTCGDFEFRSDHPSSFPHSMKSESGRFIRLVQKNNRNKYPRFRENYPRQYYIRENGDFFNATVDSVLFTPVASEKMFGFHKFEGRYLPRAKSKY